MKIYLSGVVRTDHLDVASRLTSVGVVVDYSFKDMRSQEVLNLIDERPLILTNRDLSSDTYLNFAREMSHRFNAIEVTRERASEFSEKSLVTISNTDQVQPLIESGVKQIGVPKSIALDKLKEHIAPLLPVLRLEGVVFHAWGRVDKEAVSSGVFASASSPSWLSGARFGNSYEYVGNLKLVTHHASKGQGKAVRARFKTKCEALGVDHALLCSDDSFTLNLWNGHQWDAYAKDAQLVGGYWQAPKEYNMSDKKNELSIKRLDHEMAVPQKQTLATQEAGARYLRSCDSCFLSAQCPAFEPQSSCKISTRPRVNSPEDIQDLLNRIIEIQGERVMFAAFAEKTQNMGANPDVSKEMETLTKLIKDNKEIFSEEASISIKAKGGGGVISQIFGGYGRGGGGGSKPSEAERLIDVSPMERDDD